MNDRFVFAFPIEFRRERVGEVSPLAFVDIELRFATLFLRAEVRVGGASVGLVVVVEFPPPRLRFLITSVFRESGLTTPCSLRNNPHALQRGWPSGFLLHNGVFVV